MDVNETIQKLYGNEEKIIEGDTGIFGPLLTAF